MAASKSRGLRWVAGLAGLAVLAISFWLTAGDSPEPRAAAGDAPAPHAPATGPAPSPAAPTVAGPGLRIAAHGRLTLDVDALPHAGPLTLSLDLSDEARGRGVRPARVISEDGRRIDTTVSLLPGNGSGVRLEIDPGFLSAGRYLIEVDTEEKRPLQLRRYVLEVK